jgi:hypothetical protein
MAEAGSAASPSSFRQACRSRHEEVVGMIRTGEEYRASLRDGREVWMSGERVHDVTTHPQFRPLVDARARI